MLALLVPLTHLFKSYSIEKVFNDGVKVHLNFFCHLFFNHIVVLRDNISPIFVRSRSADFKKIIFFTNSLMIIILKSSVIVK